MSLPPVPPPPGASSARASEHFGPPPGRRPSPGELREACLQFEGIFLSMLLRQMRATVPRNGLLSTGISGEIFDSLWTQEIARQATLGRAGPAFASLGARSSPLGIADALAAALSASPYQQTSQRLKPHTSLTEDITSKAAESAPPLPGRRTRP